MRNLARPPPLGQRHGNREVHEPRSKPKGIGNSENYKFLALIDGGPSQVQSGAPWEPLATPVWTEQRHKMGNIASKEVSPIAQNGEIKVRARALTILYWPGNPCVEPIWNSTCCRDPNGAFGRCSADLQKWNIPPSRAFFGGLKSCTTLTDRCSRLFGS